MSDDLKRLLRGLKLAALIILPLSVIYFGWSAFRASRERQAREYSERSSLQWEQDRQRALQKQVQTENARRLSAKSKPPSKPPANANQAKNVNLRHVVFSPDGRFLAAAAQYQSVGELTVWPASGGATLLRHKFVSAVDWQDKNTLLIDRSLWRIHKNKGYWDVDEVNSGPTQSTSGQVDSFRNFPHQDVRLQSELYWEIEGNASVAKSRLAAYSLISGTRLPLPPELEIQSHSGHIANIEPLARWGKEPLRLARWKEDDALVAVDAPVADSPESRSKLEVWDARAKKRLWKKSFPASEGRLLVGAAGKFLIAVGTPLQKTQDDYFYRTHGIEVYDSSQGKLLAKTQAKDLKPETAVLSPDGSLLAILVRQFHPKTQRIHHAVFIYRARTLQLIKKLTLSSTLLNMTGMAFSPDNSRLAVAIDGSLHLYNWRAADAFGKAPVKMAWS